jgi:hypothetical protein
MKGEVELILKVRIVIEHPLYYKLQVDYKISIHTSTLSKAVTPSMLSSNCFKRRWMHLRMEVINL